MIAFLLWSIPFFVVAAVVFFFTAKWTLALRIGIALAIWLIPTAMLTVWVIHTGDKAPPDAITVVPGPSGAQEKGAKDPVPKK
jgi:hypothetical protein